VSGLTNMDVRALDIFEGDVSPVNSIVTDEQEYKRRRVVVRTLSAPSSIHDLPTYLVDPEAREPADTAQAQITSTERDTGEERECWIYAWSAPLERLEPKIWKYVFISFHHSCFLVSGPLCEVYGKVLKRQVR
jgi:hypothetical protein